jgi:hypothetical protein
MEIFVETDFETHPEERPCFALINIPSRLMSEATGQGGTTRREEGSMIPWPRHCQVDWDWR